MFSFHQRNLASIAEQRGTTDDGTECSDNSFIVDDSELGRLQVLKLKNNAQILQPEEPRKQHALKPSLIKRLFCQNVNVKE